MIITNKGYSKEIKSLGNGGSNLIKSLVFNIGSNNFLQSTVLNKINNNDYKGIKLQILKQRRKK